MAGFVMAPMSLSGQGFRVPLRLGSEVLVRRYDFSLSRKLLGLRFNLAEGDRAGGQLRPEPLGPIANAWKRFRVVQRYVAFGMVRRVRTASR
jgi:hypothetical protein